MLQTSLCHYTGTTWSIEVEYLRAFARQVKAVTA